MLHLFRKYQRFLFIVITVIIIISFSFFGTYSTIGSISTHDQPAFTAVDGKPISRGEVEAMALFIGTDREDKLMFGGMWGPNFFNDGVIRQNFLNTGMAEILAHQYRAELLPDLQTRYEREARYSPYAHPQAPFINANVAWGYFAPEIQRDLESIKKAKGPFDQDAFPARVRLYLTEKQFPQSLLKQVLRYQERQYQWVQADPGLDQADLSLFGYHTVEDWFGPRFIRLASEFIINSAKIAEEKGYKVSNEEALADLMRNSQISFQENKSSPYLGLANSEEYFQEQLRRMGMDKTKAIKIWRQVLLFRRLYQDFGNSAIADPTTYESYLEYSKETSQGDLYKLPAVLALSHYRSLQKFEFYLNAVSKRPQSGPALLDLPTTFYTPSEVAKKHPELVKKTYLLNVAKVDANSLQGKVSVKQMWEWQTTDANWDILKKNFPEIGIAKANNPDERFSALESLDDNTRVKVNAFSRKAIVEANPEWLEKALADAPFKQTTVELRSKGGSFPIEGITNRDEFFKLLDQATVGQVNHNPNEADKKLARFTSDNRHVYSIKVISREGKDEILTYVEADNDGTIGKLLDAELEKHYKKIRESATADYQKADKTWREFAEVSEKVADSYFAKLIEEIKKDYQANKAQLAGISEEPRIFTGDFAASHRFFAYVRKVKDAIMKDPESAIPQYTATSKEVMKIEKGMDPLNLADQWKLEKTGFKVERSGQGLPGVDKNIALSLPINEWSPIFAQANGEYTFFLVQEKGANLNISTQKEMIGKVQNLLSANAEKMLMIENLQVMTDKNALSLDYLQRTEELSAMEP